MMHQHDVLLWDDRADPPEPLFNTLEVANVLRCYTDMTLRDEIMPVPEVGSNVMVTTLVREGRAAIWTDFATSRNIHARWADPGLAPFPEAVNAANPRSTYGFFISAGTVHPEAAWRWLSYLSANYRPSLDGNLPGRRSVAERLPWWQGLDEETRAVFEYALTHPLASNDALNAPLLLAVVAVFEDGVSVEEALAAAQERALKMQAGLAEVTPPAPRPVASPPPTPGEGQTVITFAPASGADMSLYRKLAASFQESHPDVWVEIAPRPVGLEELVTTSDCFWGVVPANISEVHQYIRSLQPLLDADVSFDLSDYYAQFLDGLQHDGELWGLPYQADALMVYANLDRFAEAGIMPPGPGWSIQDFLNAAVALSGDGQHGQYGFTTHEGAYGDLIFVLERLGARLYDYPKGHADSREPPTPTFDDATVVTALGQYADLSRGRQLSPKTPPTQCGWPDSIAGGVYPVGVQSGQVAMWINRISYQVLVSPPPFESGVAPLPLGAQTWANSPSPGSGQSPVPGSGQRAEPASTEFDVHAYFISIHAAAPQACWEWLTYLSDRPEVVQLLPARRSVAASPQWQEQVGEAALPAYQATLEYADTPLLGLRWEILWLGYAYPWLDEAFQAAVAGEDAGRALGQAQAKAEAFVACLEDSGGFSDHDRLLACARQVDPDYPLADANR
jgi:ABC-type glycerol-3-phosphate transport system substrate-binding protein